MMKLTQPIITEWISNEPRKMRIVYDVRYITNDGELWGLKRNDIIDGASIPRFLWTFTGSPFVGLYREPSAFHDVECVRKNKPWAIVHKMFYNAMLENGVPKAKAKAMYYAVYNFGPRWKL